MNDWWKKCEHGSLVPHDFDNHWQGVSDCPGGSPVTAADLEGEKVWSCFRERETNFQEPPEWCAGQRHEVCGWRLLIPIPDPQPATEGM